MPFNLPLNRLPFLLHILIETPASHSFFFHPSVQLTIAADSQTSALLHQYATLLLTSVIIALIFLLRPLDVTSQRVAGALSFYHAAPLLRAWGRLRKGEWVGTLGEFGGPVVHFCVHGVAMVALCLVWVLEGEGEERIGEKVD